jgi:phosphoserine aminotransferase
MLCVEDALDSLRWAESVGGLSALIARSLDNLGVLSSWVDRTPWIEFLARDPAYRSSTSICFSLTEPWFQAFSKEAKMAYVKKLTGLLDKKGVAYDIASYVDAPPGLRIWGGSTIESSDLEALTPWLEWAYAEARDHH